MNYKQQTEEGREIIRKEGTNFETFKRKASRILFGAENMSEDEWVHLYNSYAEYRFAFRNKESVTEYVRDVFQEQSPDNHSIYLKSKRLRK